MNRRDFLTVGAGAAAAVWTGCTARPPAPRLGPVMTVRGPVSPDAMGMTLPHEHLMVDFAPIADVGPHRYDRTVVVDAMLPYLLEIKDLGVQTFVDATPNYLGRDPLVLRALSERSGLQILTNTGYYGARDDAHVPRHAFATTAEEMARGWIGEWDKGIDGTGVRPGFMKIGVDAEALSEIDAKLVRAAGITHLATGLTIAAHTGPAVPAFEEIDILEELGVHPAAWIWVHAQAEEHLATHVEAARRGAWVEFDGVRPDSVERHVELVLNMRRHGLLNRVLVSQDAGWYSVGEEGGGEVRGYATLVTDFLPALRGVGLEEDEIDRLVRVNPAEAFRIRVRRLHVDEDT